MHHRRFLGSGCPFFRTRYFAIRSGCPSANRILGDWPFPNHFREALLWKRGLVRQVIGFVSYVVVGKGRGSAARPFRAQLVQRFGKNSARKPRYPTTGASFLRSIAGCFSVAGRIPRSAHRPIRGRPTTRGFPVGYLGFRAKICLGGCTISDSHAIPIRKSNLPFRALAFPVYYRKRPLMAIALQFFVCLAISMLPRVSR